MSRTPLHIVLLCLCTTLSVHAQQSEVYVDTDSVTVGDRFSMTVLLGHDGTHPALFPHDLLSDSLRQTGGTFSLGDFEFLSVLSSGSRPYANGGQIDSVVYEVTTFAVDSARVAGIPLGLVEGADTLTGATVPFSMPVTSLVGPDDTGIRDIAPIAEFERSLWPWIVGFLALLAVLAGLWWWRRRNTEEEQPEVERAVPALPPYDEALERLRSLENMDLSEQANLKPFYVELTDILRTYVARRTDVPALESTTRELFERMERTPAGQIVPSDVLDEMHKILDDADLVKFADWKPVPDDARSVVALTRSAISDTEDAYRSEMQRRAQAFAHEGDVAEGNMNPGLPRNDAGTDSSGDGATTPPSYAPTGDDWKTVPEGAWPATKGNGAGNAGPESTDESRDR